MTALQQGANDEQFPARALVEKVRYSGSNHRSKDNNRLRRSGVIQTP